MSSSFVTSDLGNSGEVMFQLINELFPICRSITGNGFRQSLRVLQRHIQLEMHEVPSGTPVFDWTVPKEWNISDAYVRNSHGEKVIDFRKSTLHILNYSIPFQGKLSLSELKSHLYTIPDQPDFIPYRTSYYTEKWGFCLSHNHLETLAEGEYEVSIQSTLEDGHLTYGEFSCQGKRRMRYSSHATAAILHFVTTTSQEWRWQLFSQKRCEAVQNKESPYAILTVFFLFQVRLARLPGLPCTNKRHSALNMAWLLPAWAIVENPPIKKAAAVTLKSTRPWSTC